ncbi:hypothetical protein MPSEU_000640300 [Mayamaea pseudoterrestris]|nr:hypothetical protein MPSEU_000640300 [Mayamaea pseudoterrestris]
MARRYDALVVNCSTAEEDENNPSNRQLTRIPPTIYPKQNVEIGTERELLIGKPNLIPDKVNVVLAELIYKLFMEPHHHSHNHPRTNPYLPPQKRYSRHRNFWVFQLNQFRHWWKTSRLLVRLSGAYCWNMVAENWDLIAMLDVTRRKQLKQAIRSEKAIGRGGYAHVFLASVHPYTRTLRIVLAVCRAWEARVDHRFYEVGLAEGFAFLGNRCFRYWSRDFVDWVGRFIALPLSGAFLQPHLEVQNRPVIITLGLMRALLPFAMSFQGSRFGRQLTYNTYRNANYRWRPTMSIMHFHEKSGNYQPIALDAQLLSLARAVAEAIGHGKDPDLTRTNLAAIGFHVFGSGTGGYSVYCKTEDKCKILLNCTPYGPSILDEMPRFILLERRAHFYSDRLHDQCDATILDAATPREAKIRGFTYSGAFFSHQEWAALTSRHDEELADYANACRIQGTWAMPEHKRYPLLSKQPSPPTDLASLKAFIRNGRQTFKQWIDDRRWREVEREVHKMAKQIARYQKSGKAPKRVILYLEGLDCAGKSSTGLLICNALQRCGYDVQIAQHNRPPTPEQRNKPWMDRSRFQYPDDMYDQDSEPPDYAALVWDRGPVGDFVYGNLDKLSFEEKMQHYKEFREYDYNCRHNDVLFFKCFFVTDRDKIAATLGKRLAHKKIAQDLKVWLDANSSISHAHEGLNEILLHIDPTDFIAFNHYEENLHRFSSVVRNTDIVGHVGGQANGPIHYRNPWLVINTSNRHAARLSMMARFRGKLDDFAVPFGEEKPPTIFSKLRGSRHEHGLEERYDSKYVPDDIVEKAERGVSWQVIIQSIMLLLLFLLYLRYAWKFGIDDITKS